MTALPALDEDHHVHSVFSGDAVSSLDENVRAARRRGLRVICFADHVRRDSPWVADYTAAVAALRPVPGLDVVAGVEAKILDSQGHLDLPGQLPGVGRVLIADHQFPGQAGPVHPRDIQAQLAAGQRTAAEVVDGLITATAAALDQVAMPQLAHLFSLLPKMGLAEPEVPGPALAALAQAARRAGARPGPGRAGPGRPPGWRPAGGQREVGLPIAAHHPGLRGRRSAAGAQHGQS